MHGLGQLDELHLVVESDEGQPLRARRVDDDGGDVAVVRTELEHEARESRGGQAPDERAQLGGVGRPSLSGGQQQLSAVEEPRDTRAVGHMHPAHARLQCRVIGEDLRTPRREHVQGEHFPHGGQTLRRRARTDCPIVGFFATLRHP